LKGQKKTLSNKDKKKLDLSRDRKEERQWKKGKGDGMDGAKDKSKRKGGKVGGGGKTKFRDRKK